MAAADPVTYHVADVVTGIVLDTLPLVGEVADTRGQVESVTWNLPLTDERTPTDWLGITQPWKIMVVAEWHGNPIQAWVIVSRRFGMAECEIGGASLERLTECVLARDGEWFNKDSAQVAAEIVNQVMVPAGGWAVEWVATGTRIDHFTTLDAASTVNNELETLESAEGGPKWRKLVRWVPGEERRTVQKVMRIGPSLGDPKPTAVFELPPSGYTRTELWDDENAALRVWATTEGSGAGLTPVPYESPLLDEGWHPKEFIASFTGLDDPELEKRKRQRGADLADGTLSWEATFEIDRAPRLVDEWNIGDTVTFHAAPSTYDPPGGTLVAVVDGWSLNPADNTITPRLIQEADVRAAQDEEGTEGG